MKPLSTVTQSYLSTLNKNPRSRYIFAIITWKFDLVAGVQYKWPSYFRSGRIRTAYCYDKILSQQQISYIVPIQEDSIDSQFFLDPISGNSSDSDRKDLLSELELMKNLKPHPHVVKLLGCVTKSGKFCITIARMCFFYFGCRLVPLF